MSYTITAERAAGKLVALFLCLGGDPMGMHKHGKDSAKGKACQKYKSEGRRERKQSAEIR